MVDITRVKRTACIRCPEAHVRMEMGIVLQRTFDLHLVLGRVGIGEGWSKSGALYRRSGYIVAALTGIPAPS